MGICIAKYPANAAARALQSPAGSKLSQRSRRRTLRYPFADLHRSGLVGSGRGGCKMTCSKPGAPNCSKAALPLACAANFACTSDLHSATFPSSLDTLSVAWWRRVLWCLSCLWVLITHLKGGSVEGRLGVLAGVLCPWRLVEPGRPSLACPSSDCRIAGSTCWTPGLPYRSQIDPQRVQVRRPRSA